MFHVFDPPKEAYVKLPIDDNKSDSPTWVHCNVLALGFSPSTDLRYVAFEYLVEDQRDGEQIKVPASRVNFSKVGRPGQLRKPHNT